MKDLSIVLQHLSKGCTCAAADGSTLLTSEKRGVAPLLGWLEQGYHLSDFTAADKVVGKGAAFLYLLLGVKYLYAGVISRPALELLKKNGVFVGMKGPSVSEEVALCTNALKVLGLSEPKIICENLRDDEQRAFVIVKKISQTPPKYPRKPADISKQPL